MKGSGMDVIEYDCEFTKHDMPNDYFTKITENSNIINIIKTIFDKEDQSSNYKGYCDKFNINEENRNFRNVINSLIFPTDQF
jgi:hypothetical protein